MQFLSETRVFAVSMIASLLAACAGDRSSVVLNDNPSPYASGKTHTEPLYYNGKTYNVQIRHEVAQRVYHVNVSAAGRTLGKSASDAQVVAEVGRNAINHFACQDGQKARIISGSAQPTAVGWDMKATCG